MADERELLEEQEEALRSAIAAHMVNVHTSMIGIVQKDSDGKTCVVQPSIKANVYDPKTGNATQTALPLIQDVPIHFSGGGGTTFTHPIKTGDEVLLVFGTRAHDAWFQSGGQQAAIDSRRHHLSDAFCIPGFRSTPRALSDISTTSAQMRSDDGKHYVDLHPTNGLTLKSKMAVTLDAPSHTIKGALTLQPDDDGNGGTLHVAKDSMGRGGTITADVSATAPDLIGTVTP